MVDFEGRSEVAVVARELSSFLQRDRLLGALTVSSKFTNTTFEVSCPWSPDPSRPDSAACFVISPDIGVCVRISTVTPNNGSEQEFEPISHGTLAGAVRNGVTIQQIKEMSENLTRRILSQVA